MDKQEPKSDADILIQTLEANLIIKFKRLVESGLDINAQNKQGYTSLMCSMDSDPSFLNVILPYKPNVNLQNNSGQTALMLGLRRMIDLPDLKALLKAGSNLNLTDEYGCNALMYALENENIELLKCILQFNPDLDLNQKEHQNLTVLDLAEQSNQTAAYDLLKIYSEAQQLRYEHKSFNDKQVKFKVL